jgi:hypothetical protein
VAKLLGATRHNITDTDHATALKAGRFAAESEFRAQAVAYRPDRDAIEIITVMNGGFVIPRHLISALQDVGPEDLAKIELWPDGSLVEIEDLNIHIAVDGMIKAALPVLVPGRIVAGLFAAFDGAAKSQAKAKSPRQNGKKGGPHRRKATAA